MSASTSPLSRRALAKAAPTINNSNSGCSWPTHDVDDQPSVCDLVHAAYIKNADMARDNKRSLIKTLHQRRLWRSLQGAFIATKDEEALANQPVVTEAFLNAPPKHKLTHSLRCSAGRPSTSPAASRSGHKAMPRRDSGIDVADEPPRSSIRRTRSSISQRTATPSPSSRSSSSNNNNSNNNNKSNELQLQQQPPRRRRSNGDLPLAAASCSTVNTSTSTSSSRDSLRRSKSGSALSRRPRRASVEDRLPVVRVAERPVIASRYRTGAAKTASTGVMGMAHAKVSRHKHMHAHAEHKDEYEYEDEDEALGATAAAAAAAAAVQQGSSAEHL